LTGNCLTGTWAVKEEFMPFENINGIKVYYESHGKGAEKGTILLLHHGFGCVKTWEEIYPRLVDEGYRVIMYDRRGYGQSKKGPGFMEFYVSDRFRPESVEEMAVLMNFFGIDRFHVLGQCEGGVVGVDYAAKFPDQIRTLVIASTQCFSEIPMTEKNTRAFPKTFRDLEPELKAKLIEWHGEDAETFYDQFRQFGGAYGTDVFDLRPALSSVGCPSLVLFPDRSFIFDVEQGVAMYRQLSKGELAVLPGCGHNTYQYRPEDYVRIVLDFIHRHDEEGEEMTAEMIGTSCLAVKKPIRA